MRIQSCTLRVLHVLYCDVKNEENEL